MYFLFCFMIRRPPSSTRTATLCPSTSLFRSMSYDHGPRLAGAVVYDTNGKPGDANGRVVKALAEAGRLLAKGKLTHSYPHSWRSKAPLIFRNTAQWFISMDTNELRDRKSTRLNSSH